MKWNELIGIINKLWPLSDAEHWDNCGMSVGSFQDEVNHILIALDLTHEVLDEAIRIGADGIITHHPLIFSPLKKIDTSSYAGSIISKALKNGIALLSLHTNLDVSVDGPSHQIAENIGLKNIEFLQTTRSSKEYKIVVFVPEENVDLLRKKMAEAGGGVIGEYSNCSFITEGIGTFLAGENSNPTVGKVGNFEKVDEIRLEMKVDSSSLGRVVRVMKENHPYEEVAYDIYNLENRVSLKGMGVIGEYDSSLKIDEICQKVMDYLKLDNLVIVDAGSDIKRVAVVSGSGTSLMHLALSRGAQLLVTGDVKHHQAVESRAIGLSMIDATHYGTEKITKNIILNGLTKEVENRIKLSISEDEFDSLSIVGK